VLKIEEVLKDFNMNNNSEKYKKNTIPTDHSCFIPSSAKEGENKLHCIEGEIPDR